MSDAADDIMFRELSDQSNVPSHRKRNVPNTQPTEDLHKRLEEKLSILYHSYNGANNQLAIDSATQDLAALFKEQQLALLSRLEKKSKDYPTGMVQDITAVPLSAIQQEREKLQ